MARKVVMDTGCLHSLNSDYKALDLIKKAGFKYYDMTLFWKGTTEHIGVGPDYKDNALALRKYADKIGLKCEQAHAYFTSGTSQESIDTRIEYTKKDMEIASILGCHAIVLHPVLHFNLEENVEFIKNFLPLAHKLKMKICLENVWDFRGGISPMVSSTPDSFVKLIDTLNDPYIVACLDIGHAEMQDLGTNAIEMVHALGKRLYCLHIHDNDRKNDSHQVPFTNQINFMKILDALKEEDYKGNITFEVETCYNNGSEIHLPLELYPAFARLELEIGNYFKKYLDNKI